MGQQLCVHRWEHHFQCNSAREGGGVSAWDSSYVYISGNTTFIGNSARYGDGGGVSAWSSCNVYISGNTTFSGITQLVVMVEE